jgi:DUF177 domain-containing protein
MRQSQGADLDTGPLYAYNNCLAVSRHALGTRSEERPAVSDNLIFNVAQLLKEPVGATRNGMVVADLFGLLPELQQMVTPAHREQEAIVSAEGEGSPAGPPVLTGPVRLMHTQGGVLVQGGLHAQATLSCSRCLEPVAVPLDVELEEIFTPIIDVLTGRPVQNEEEDRALWIDDRHLLDLGEVLRQDVLLALPMHVLCREDCRGLCPTCGQNLNQGSCGCTPEPDTRWAALLDLLKE